MSNHRLKRLWLWGALGVLLLLVASVGFVLWSRTTPQPGSGAVDALLSDDRVTVIEDDGYTFEPVGGALVGLVLYPGGRIDPASYASPARAIAEAGYLVVVPRLRLNLAVLDSAAANEVMASHPEIETWVVGGHSLGGAMVADYAVDHSEVVSGLVLWAAYPSSGTNLSRSNLEVASIYGTRDGLTSIDDIEESRSRLPSDAAFVAIDGGNHAQFGDYGPQSGDNPATITLEEQHRRAVRATLDVLGSVE